MFIQERLTMTLFYIRSHSPLIHGDGWYATVLLVFFMFILCAEIFHIYARGIGDHGMNHQTTLTANCRIRAWSIKATS